MSLPQARETSTAYRQTDWSQYISCIRYRIAWLPGGSGFGAVLHPVIVVVLKLLVVDRCPTRMSSIFGQWGSLGRLGWIMRAFYSYYAPRISPIQVDAVGCKVSGPTVRMSIDSTVFLCVCVSLERETERERERETKREKERERERERERGEIERERERREIEREGREGREDSQDLPSFRAKLLFHFFCARKQTTFPPMGGVTVHWGAAGLTCMRNGDYHGVIIEADLALPIACALPPPFLLWLVAYCTFSTHPPSCSRNTCDRSLHWHDRTSGEDRRRSSRAIDRVRWNMKHFRQTARATGCCLIALGSALHALHLTRTREQRTMHGQRGMRCRSCRHERQPVQNDQMQMKAT